MQELASLLLWKCNDSMRWYARLLITVVHVLCCTIFPNFRYDTVLEFITSFWIIFVYAMCVQSIVQGCFLHIPERQRVRPFEELPIQRFIHHRKQRRHHQRLHSLPFRTFHPHSFIPADKKSLRLRQPLLHLPAHRHGAARSLHRSRPLQRRSLRSHRQSTLYSLSQSHPRSARAAG